MKQWRDLQKALDARKGQLREKAAQVKQEPAPKIADLNSKIEDLQQRVDGTTSEEIPLKAELRQAQADLALAQAADANLDDKYFKQLYSLPGEATTRRIPLKTNGRFSWVDDNNFMEGEKGHPLFDFLPRDPLRWPPILGASTLQHRQKSDETAHVRTWRLRVNQGHPGGPICRPRNKSSKVAAQLTWSWRRWIAPGSEDAWIGKLQAAIAQPGPLPNAPTASASSSPFITKNARASLPCATPFGGTVRSIRQNEWLATKAAPPTRIGHHLEIVHGTSSGSRRTPCDGRRSRIQPVPALHIPHGLAFGSGEHATTFMLLRALTAPRDWPRTTLLDLGTGSGVLALATRLLGARKILATDFDPDAIRTARQNEALNFPTPLIRWRRADVRKLSPAVRHDLVLANLFSGILSRPPPGSQAPCRRAVSFGSAAFSIHSRRKSSPPTARRACTSPG